MDVNFFITALTEKFVEAKEIKQEVAKLQQSVVLMEFLDANPVQVNPSTVCSFLMQTSIKLVGKKINIQLVKNIYNEYSVIFAICMLNKTINPAMQKKLQKIFEETIKNSSKFDIYYKKNINLKKVADQWPMEFFWLIPLFKNVDIFTKMETEKFIGENIKIAVVDMQYVDGYEYYVVNLTQYGKDEYKLFINEGIQMRRKALSLSNNV